MAEQPFGADAELQRLMSCPRCGSAKVARARDSIGGYGVLGLKALSDIRTGQPVRCANCGNEWVRPPVRELRKQAERNIEERFDRLEAENRRLREQLPPREPS